MSLRRANRIAAVQFIYMWDINPSSSLADALQSFWREQKKLPKDYAFSESLICGVVEQQEKLDATIQTYAHNWEFSRIARIDLAILRLATYELYFRSDIPPIVSINEAIELSRQFSIEEAKRFINGILDRCKLDLKRPFREALKSHQPPHSPALN